MGGKKGAKSWPQENLSLFICTVLILLPIRVWVFSILRRSWWILMIQRNTIQLCSFISVWELVSLLISVACPPSSSYWLWITPKPDGKHDDLNKHTHAADEPYFLLIYYSNHTWPGIKKDNFLSELLFSVCVMVKACNKVCMWPPAFRLEGPINLHL